MDLAVAVDDGGDARRTSAIEPEAGSNPTAPVFTGEWRLVVRVIKGGIDRFHIANAAVGWAIRAAVAFDGTVDAAEFERIHTQLLGHFIEHRF